MSEREQVHIYVIGTGGAPRASTQEIVEAIDGFLSRYPLCTRPKFAFVSGYAKDGNTEAYQLLEEWQRATNDQHQYASYVVPTGDTTLSRCVAAWRNLQTVRRSSPETVAILLTSARPSLRDYLRARSAFTGSPDNIIVVDASPYQGGARRIATYIAGAILTLTPR